MRRVVVLMSFCSAVAAAPAAAPAMPAAVASTLRGSGLPVGSFGVYVQAVDIDGAPPLLALNAEQPFLLASTTKLVTSAAALDLLGPAYRWRSHAVATAPPVDGRIAGDLVLVGGSGAGLTAAELKRWFRLMRDAGLREVAGRIVLDRFTVLHEDHPAQIATTVAERAPGGVPDPRTYTAGALRVVVQPARGTWAAVTVTPKPAGVVLVNDVLMGGGCAVRATWDPAQGSAAAAPRRLLVNGRWDTGCGRQEVALVRRPATLAAHAEPRPALPAAGAASAPVSSAALVASLWADAGLKLRGRVVEARAPAPLRPAGAPGWSSELATPLSVVVREVNKTSNNVAARYLLLALAADAGAPTALRAAQQRIAGWLRAKGLGDGDIHIDQGSGQSRAERGKPRAMVQMLHDAWHGRGAREFVDSLPIAGVDGTLAHRMRNGGATGRAFLKTGTLNDTRALAGYVRAKSGKVYAVSVIVNHPSAGRGTPALDALVEWVANNG